MNQETKERASESWRESIYEIWRLAKEVWELWNSPGVKFARKAIRVLEQSSQSTVRNNWSSFADTMNRYSDREILQLLDWIDVDFSNPEKVDVKIWNKWSMTINALSRRAEYQWLGWNVSIVDSPLRDIAPIFFHQLSENLSWKPYIFFYDHPVVGETLWKKVDIETPYDQHTIFKHFLLDKRLIGPVPRPEYIRMVTLVIHSLKWDLKRKFQWKLKELIYHVCLEYEYKRFLETPQLYNISDEELRNMPISDEFLGKHFKLMR